MASATSYEQDAVMKIPCKSIAVLSCFFLLAGCTLIRNSRDAMVAPHESVTLTPRTSSYRDLISLPQPKGKVAVAVYGFRDQTGQYKSAPASSFSTSVTQGGSAMLMNALQASGWFVVAEREGLQNLLTERKVIRSSQTKKEGEDAGSDGGLPPLMPANILLEGGVVAYDSDVRTGGIGVRYLGVDVAEQYRVDQITVNLRAVDIRSGRVMINVLTTKSLLSREVSAGVFKYIEFKRLLEAEAGYTTNEPAQLCLLSAIEAGVIHMIAQGLQQGIWLGRLDTGGHEIIQAYLDEKAVIIER
jgi:curli production assembly/transport component CsgG